MATKHEDTKADKAEQSAPLPPVITPAMEQAAARVAQYEDDKKLAEQLKELQGKGSATGKGAREAEQRKKEADAKDREGRTVQVRALRTGQYPADGGIKQPGSVFDYVLNKNAKGKVEEELPSWMEDVDGDIPTRSLDLSPPEQPTVIEIRGTGPNATVTKAAAK